MTDPAADAISQLAADNHELEERLAGFERLGEHAYKSKRQCIDDIVRLLRLHLVLMEDAVHPAVRDAPVPTKHLVLYRQEEHHLIMLLAAELEQFDPQHERFQPKALLLADLVRRHLADEQGEVDDVARTALRPEVLARLAEELTHARRSFDEMR